METAKRNGAKGEWRQAKGGASGRADAPLLGAHARGRYEQALPFPERAPALETPQHRLRRPDSLRHRLRRRWRVGKDRRRRSRRRHRRRHGAALRRLRSRRAEFLGLDDDQRTGADHHGDVYRGRETPLWRRRSCRISAARFRPTFSRKSRRRTKPFSRRKHRSVSSAT